jgi:glycosyltransferase involved in cell wall biosynthesis
MSAAPRVQVGVPVWRGKRFVAEALESVLRQRDVDFSVLISVDGPDPESEQACRPFLADARVRMVVQPARLGWARNASALFGAAVAKGATYACIQPYDDLIAESYLAVLMSEAERRPQAAVTYCDIETFGTFAMKLAQPPVAGSPLERQLELLQKHFNAVAWRGLARVSALRSLPPLRGNPFEDFAADTVWMALMARAGDLVRVAKTLYRKRYHSNNMHAAWTGWPRERKLAAWARHCGDMLAQAVTVAADADARRLVEDAARARLLGQSVLVGPYHSEVTSLEPGERERMLAEFAAAAGLSMQPHQR